MGVFSKQHVFIQSEQSRNLQQNLYNNDLLERQISTTVRKWGLPIKSLRRRRLNKQMTLVEQE